MRPYGSQGYEPEDFGAGEWRMDEQTDGSLRQGQSKKGRGQQEMVVVYPD